MNLQNKLAFLITYMWNLYMTQMNLSVKQNQRHRETGGCQGRGGWERAELGVWDQQIQTGKYRTDKYQGPSVQHRELYLIFYDKPQ